MAQNWANQNRDVANALQHLLEAYDMGGGSNTYTMASLRGSFAQTIPFDAPNFHRHFSIFATEAVARDFRANRYTYPIGGLPPDPAIPIQDSPPYIFPTQLLQNAGIQAEGGERKGEGDERRDDPQYREREGHGGQAEEDQQGRRERRGEEEPRESGGVDRGSRKRSRLFREDEGSEEGDREDTPLSVSSAAHVFTFIKTAKAVDKPLPKEAREITKFVLEYREKDLNAAVLAFCWKAGKPHEFPDALVRDLLQYKFIDLKKFNAGPTACKLDIYSTSKNSDPESKIKPKPFGEAKEWRDAVMLLVESLSVAFVGFFFQSSVGSKCLHFISIGSQVVSVGVQPHTNIYNIGAR